MNKDVIYIDIEDDITGIIDKVKSAGTKIVALVPPKRIGVLQSVVNLKLLQKAATEVDKRVVLITSDHSLTALAAGVKMPVAKNLQSRPEVPSMESPKTADEEIINGQELAVGDVAKSLGGDAVKAASAADAISDGVDIADATKSAPKPPQKLPQVAKMLGGKPKMAIPNFKRFRKRLLLLGGLGAALILFLIWAFVFAPHATVTISAKTTNVDVQKPLVLRPSVTQSDTTNFVLKPVVQQIKKSVANEFTATGTKDIGDKAKGTMTITNGNSSDQSTVPAGTNFTGADGHVFTSDASVTVPGAKVVGGAVQAGSVTVAATASDIGPDYNVASQSYTVAGFSGLGASGTAMSGGTKQTVTVVSQADVDKAKAQLASQDVNAAKADLKKQFTPDAQIIEESFSADQSAPTVSPDVGAQAQTAKLTVETTYTYVAIARADINKILTNAANAALQGMTEQQIYSLGDNTVSFANFQKADGGNYTARMDTTERIGPKIDTASLAKQLAGKRSGEIQAVVNQISGVSNVDVVFSPFWVSTAPGANKIDIKFSVSQNSSNGQ
ncbi:MAG TPA: hypothetical protein VLG40_03975 [Candidatus Saccharimonas sp.]|nr:hypothetical protein [Candidatus Saccharimonas sp.]